MPYAITALASVKRFVPNSDLFLFSDELFSNGERELIGARGVETIHLETSELFASYSDYRPTVAFGIFEAPAVLHDRGYQYSLALDADVYCARKFDILSIFSGTQTFAGIANYPIEANWKNSSLEMDKLLEGFAAPPASADARLLKKPIPNPNTGVLFFNNLWAKNFGLKEKACAMAKAFSSELMGGDQALLAALIFSHKIRYHVLPSEFNLRLSHPLDKELRGMAQKVHFVHFTGPRKPWLPWWASVPTSKLTWAHLVWRLRWKRFHSSLNPFGAPERGAVERANRFLRSKISNGQRSI